MAHAFEPGIITEPPWHGIDPKNIWTTDRIKTLLMTNNEAVERAIVAIYHRQTLGEQASGETVMNNGVGFSSAHSRSGTYFAKWVLRGNRLTGNYLEKARRISLRYTGQLLSIIEEKN